MTPSNIAVVGSGIAGLSAAWLLSRNHNVTLFERGETLGGHSNTVSVEMPEGEVPVDTGFIVYNEKNYPNLTAFFHHLDVETTPSCMSFAVSIAEGRMEYSGRHLAGLFGQRSNILRREHWRLVTDIMRFFKEAQRQVSTCSPDMSIGEFLNHFGYSEAFVDDHILPMSAAIWSTPSRGMLDFPAHTFIQFFANHSLLQVSGRPVWRTVRNGSREYVKAALADARMDTVTGAQIVGVRRHGHGAELRFADGTSRPFAQVVLACHADDALALLDHPSEAEQRVLSAFRYTTNHAVLHTDARFMPLRKNLWSSWNYLRADDDRESLSLTYWMNRLQPLRTRTNLFVTLNPHKDFAKGSVLREISYEHPLFDTAAIDAQRELWQIQGANHTWFAGAWMGYGFHEDGIQSGLEVAERIGSVGRPWTVPKSRGRIAHNWEVGDQLQRAAE